MANAAVRVPTAVDPMRLAAAPAPTASALLPDAFADGPIAIVFSSFETSVGAPAMTLVLTAM